jgi:hypothetical protein
MCTFSTSQLKKVGGREEKQTTDENTPQKVNYMKIKGDSSQKLPTDMRKSQETFLKTKESLKKRHGF